MAGPLSHGLSPRLLHKPSASVGRRNRPRLVLFRGFGNQRFQGPMPGPRLFSFALRQTCAQPTALFYSLRLFCLRRSGSPWGLPPRFRKPLRVLLHGFASRQTFASLRPLSCSQLREPARSACGSASVSLRIPRSPAVSSENRLTKGSLHPIRPFPLSENLFPNCLLVPEFSHKK